MHHLPYKNLVGYLIGSIMPHSPILHIGIYSAKDGRHTLSITTEKTRTYLYEVVRRKARLYAPVLQRVWRNNARPGWYYLQLDEQHPPKVLHGWAVPITVYGDWGAAKVDGQGLVGCAISLHDDGLPVPDTDGPAPWYGQGKADDD